MSCTCRYAEERIAQLEAQGKLTRRSRFQRWKPLTREDFNGFLAIILNMGIVRLPEIEDYWKTTWESQIPFFGRVMPRDHFELIFWMLHVSHTEGNTQKKVDKVRMLLNKLLERFQQCYYPTCQLAVDETMVGFRGRYSARQYMPNKPTKWGIKCFTLADSSNGYILNVLVYTGRETLEHVSYEHLPQPAQIVLHLTDAYLGCGHHVFTDRYYTSLPLAQTLHAHNTSFTGTSNKNRVGLPVQFRGSYRLHDGEVIAYRHDHLLALTWRAEKKKKPVIIVSTAASAATALVQSTNRFCAPILKPVVIDTYNHHMNGVDIADQHTVYYSFIRKTVKWWRKLCFWLLETAVVNSYVLYRESTPLPKSHIHYRRSLIDSSAASYVTTAPPRPRPGRPWKRNHPESHDDPERLNKHLHLLEKTSVQRDCVVCSKTERRVRPSYKCKTCPDGPYLCPGTCFERYRTLVNYKLP